MFLMFTRENKGMGRTHLLILFAGDSGNLFSNELQCGFKNLISGQSFCFHVFGPFFS